MPDEAKTFGGRWRVVDRLGKGGQGVVYKVADMEGVPVQRDQVLALQEGLRGIWGEIHQMSPDVEKFAPLVTALRTITLPPVGTFAALKELLPIDEAEAADAETAFARMKNELATLTGVSHPALIKVLGSDLDHGWFVMEYFRNGSMSKQPGRFVGKVAKALNAFRPLVEAVNELHKK